jgi:hypothetical protein
MFVNLEPLAARRIDADHVISQLRGQLAGVRVPRCIFRRSGPPDQRPREQRAVSRSCAARA